METGPAPSRQVRAAHETRQTKTCMYCGEQRPASDFRRRTGKRAGPGARRGACRRCRQLGTRNEHHGQAAVVPDASMLRQAHDGTDQNLRQGKAQPRVTNERERNTHGSVYQRGENARENNPESRVHSDVTIESAPSDNSGPAAEQLLKDAAISSASSSGSQRKKRRRRRKRKPSEMISAHTSGEVESERESSTGQDAVDDWRPGGAYPPGEVHSQGAAAANAQGSAQRARRRAAAVVPAAEQASAAGALLPASPQGQAAAPLPAAADPAAAARPKRKRRRKRAAALASGAGQARSGAAEAPAPEPGTARGDGSTGSAPAAAKAQPAAAGREPSHSSRSHGAGMDGRPRRHHTPPPAIDPEDPASLRTNRQGMVRMRGKTDKGRRWHQEVDMELAVTLVKEKAAVVVNRYTIRRLFSNKDFKRFILDRDNYTCYFCSSYGDTIDHLLPRAKGGHTTPLNCVCACNLCNQSKAAMDAEEFIRSGIPEWNAAHQAELLELAMQETGLE